MELGHNITHGQWDWMNDREIHSNTCKWDTAALTSQWRYPQLPTPCVLERLAVDADLGFRVLRVTRYQQWRLGSPCWQPLGAVLLAVAFEWGVAQHGLYLR